MKRCKEHPSALSLWRLEDSNFRPNVPYYRVFFHDHGRSGSTSFGDGLKVGCVCIDLSLLILKRRKRRTNLMPLIAEFLLNEVLEDKDEKEQGKSLYFIPLYTGSSILAGIDLVNKLYSCSNALRDSTALFPLFTRRETETEMQRASGKVDRALEQLRRCITPFILHE